MILLYFCTKYFVFEKLVLGFLFENHTTWTTVEPCPHIYYVTRGPWEKEMSWLQINTMDKVTTHWIFLCPNISWRICLVFTAMLIITNDIYFEYKKWQRQWFCYPWLNKILEIFTFLQFLLKQHLYILNYVSLEYSLFLVPPLGYQVLV